MEATFTPMERELLLEILQEHHRELIMEIARTTHRDFRQVLKRKEEMLESIVQKLEHYQPSEKVLQEV